MKRRTLLKNSVLATGTAALSGGVVSAAAQSGPAIVKDRKVFSIFSPDPNSPWPTSEVVGGNAVRFFEWVERATDGEIVLELFNGEDQIPEDGEYEYVMKGDLDGYFNLEYHWKPHSAAFGMFGGAMPMGLTADEHSAWIYHGGGQALWDELSGKFGIKPLIAGNIGLQMIGWFNKEINSPADVEGTIMHMPGWAGSIMRDFGATTQDFPNSALLEGLRDGRLAAVEKASPWIDLGYRFYEGAKYYYTSPFHEPCGVLALGMNQAAWDSMSANQQRIVGEICMAHNAYSMAESKMQNARAFRIMTQDHGVERRYFPEEMMLRIGEFAGELLRSIESEDDLHSRIASSYRDFRNEAMAWTDASVVEFASNRGLDYSF